MALDEFITTRFRTALGDVPGLSEKRMMGGHCFFLNGNMIGGADKHKDGHRRFMFRVGKQNQAVASALPGATPMIQGGRLMTGLYFVDADSCDDNTLSRWVTLAHQHAASLKPK